MEKKWQLQDAKNKFSQLVDEVVKTNEIQIITKHGKDTVVILSFDEYKKLTRKKGSLVNFFRDSPLAEDGIDIERIKDYSRDIEI